MESYLSLNAMRSYQTSVVIPAYNSAVWLPETLASVYAQRNIDLEVIVVDDGSTDDTAEIIKRFPGVRYFSQANAGAATARNVGITAAKGAYIAFLDADDIWEPHKLERQTYILDRHEHVGLVFSNYVPFGMDVEYRTGFDRSRVLPRIRRRAIGPDAYVLESESLFVDLLDDLFSWNSTLLVRKTVIENVGSYCEALRFSGEDWMMCLRLSKVCDFAFVDDCLVRRREHAGSSSRTAPDEAQAALVLEQLIGWERLTASEDATVRRYLATKVFDLGYHELKRGELQSARERFRRYFQVIKTMAPSDRRKARRPRAVAYFASTWLPSRIVRRASGAKQRGDSPSSKKTSGDFEQRWRERFISFAEESDDDAGIAGWTRVGLATRLRQFKRVFSRRLNREVWLDAGCGAGTYTRYLVELGASVLGLDYSLPTVLKAVQREIDPAWFCVGDATRLPVRGETFDGVICLGVTQALSDSERLVGSLVRSIRPGGQLWVDALNGACVVHRVSRLWRWLRQRPPHLRYEQPRRLVRVLRSHGLHDVQVIWMPMLPGRFRSFQWVLETAPVTILFRVVPLLGALLSHSFVVQGRLNPGKT